MNNEIKEILDYLDYGVNSLSISKPPFKIEYEDIKKLLDYITNLQQELEKTDSITQSCIFNGKKESKISYRKCLNALDKKETQQKEFIKYLENMLDDENDIFSVVRVKDVLQKYKEIIGENNE